MGFWDKVKGELIDIVEWTDDSPDTMVWRFPRHGNEIKYGAKLVVREGQMAVLVNEGRAASAEQGGDESVDAFQPGTYQLSTKNLPVLSTILGWPYGFESPFKAEVYFFNTRRFSDLKWGTKNPVTLRDPEFGPVRLRAFGTYQIRVVQPLRFLRQVVGTDSIFTTEEIADQLRNEIVARFSDILGESGIPVLDLAANYDELGRFVSERLAGDFGEYGLEVTRLLVENVSLPPAVEEALDKRTSMGVIGDLEKYTRYQTAEALGDAARNPGGAGEGMGLGMGFAMGKQMADALGGSERPAGAEGISEAQPAGQGGAGQGAAAPPPVPGESRYHVALDGEAAGPFSLSGLRELAGDSRLTPDTLVWTEGMDDWLRAGDVSALAGLFESGPPPLPGR